MTKVNSATSSTSDFEPAHPKYRIIRQEREYDGYFKIDRYTVETGCAEDESLQTFERYVFERGDAVAVLLHNVAATDVVLVRQFRMPPLCRGDVPWFPEIIAGTLRPGDDPVEMAIREVMEEAGVRDVSPVFRALFYLSPGGSTERCFLYTAEVDTGNLEGHVGGEARTEERTCVEVHGIASVQEMIARGEIQDAKTILAIQDFLIRRIKGNDNGTASNS
ncbi:MAG TPA: NUDIX domain-containing protein [bacterium]|nr:NUDIX domain-containing protein [bacterium]